MRHFFHLAVRITIVVFSSFLSFAHAYGQWQWARNASPTAGNVFGGISATSITGNVYLSGYLNTSSSTFGAHTITDSNLEHHPFLVKYDSFGIAAWARGSETVNGAESYAIATDRSGNILMAGCFLGPYLRFDSVMLYNSDVFGGSKNMFVAKFDAASNISWARAVVGDVGYDAIATSTYTDASGNVFVSGNYNSPFMAFGTDSIWNPWYNYGSDAIFVAKYDSVGNLLWVKNFSGKRNGGGHVNGSVTDASGNFYFTGYFNDSSFTFGGTTLTNASIYHNSFYLTKLGSSGNVIWARGANDLDAASGNSVVIDPAGHLCVGGTFNYSIDFGLGALTTAHMFLVKFDTSGHAIWNTAANTNGAISVATDIEGNILATGSFGGTITLGAYTFTDTSSLYYNDMFVVKYDSSGSVIWADGIGGYYDVNPASVCTYANSAYLSGWGGCPHLVFGSVNLINSSPYFNCYLAKLGNTEALSTPDMTEGSSHVAVFPNPNTGKFTVRLDEQHYSGVEVYDLLGKVIYKAAIGKGQRTVLVAIPDQAAGFYYLRLTSDKGNQIAPFIIGR